MAKCLVCEVKRATQVKLHLCGYCEASFNSGCRPCYDKHFQNTICRKRLADGVWGSRYNTRKDFMGGKDI